MVSSSRPKRPAQSSLRHALPAILGTLLTPACGGESGERPTEKPEAPAERELNSDVPDCPRPTDEHLVHVFTDWLGHESTLEFEMLEDWEFGAGIGWYTNNPVCTECQDLGETCLDEPSDGSPIRLCSDPEDPVQPRLDACWVRCVDFQEPSYFEKPLPATEIPDIEGAPDPGRCGSRYALRIQAGPYYEVRFEVNEGWGGVIGRQWQRDASDWDGISFWGRISWTESGPAGRNTIRLQVSDELTDQDWVEDHPEADGEPRCETDVSRDMPEVGCDKWGAFAGMERTWRFFALPFSEMRQAGWGRSEDHLRVWALKSLGFEYDIGLWDFWIDDIALYRRRSQ
jgi:hypothetical protein